MRCLDCGTAYKEIAHWQIRCTRCYARNKREELLSRLEQENRYLREQLERKADSPEIPRLRLRIEGLQDEIARLKREQARRRPDPDIEVRRLRIENERLREAASRGGLDRDFVRQLLQVAHPDKHNGSDLSLRVTRRLLAMKDG